MARVKDDEVTFMPSADFTGYPHGKKHQFQAGILSIPVPESYAALMRDKGLVAAEMPFTPVADEPKDDK